MSWFFLTSRHKGKIFSWITVNASIVDDLSLVHPTGNTKVQDLVSCFLFISGYSPVAVDDKLLPSQKDPKSFDYSSIFSYDVPKDQVKFKSVFKFEDTGRTSYEADYFKVTLFMIKILVFFLRERSVPSLEFNTAFYE